MKFIYLSSVLTILLVGTCEGAEPQISPEETCKKNVDVKIQAIEEMQKNTGQEMSLAGLTIAEIRKIETDEGVCAASLEINRRMLNSEKEK